MEEGNFCSFYKGETCFLGTYWERVVLEEIKSLGDFFESKNKKYLPVERLNGETINLPVSYKEGDDWKSFEDEELIAEWCKQTETPFPPFLEVPLTESKKTEERKGTEKVSQKWDSESLAYLATVVICVPASIFLFVTASEFGDTASLLTAFLSAGCSVWGIIKMLGTRNQK